MQTVLAEKGHPQPPISVVTDNIEANIIVSGISEQKISREIDMIFYWV